MYIIYIIVPLFIMIFKMQQFNLFTKPGIAKCIILLEFNNVYVYFIFFISIELLIILY